VTWPKGPMRGWGFGGGAAQRAPSPSTRRSEESCLFPNPPSQKISYLHDLHESFGLWPCLSTVGNALRVPPPCLRGYATVQQYRTASLRVFCIIHTRQRWCRVVSCAARAFCSLATVDVLWLSL